MSTLLEVIKLVLTDPHTSYETSVYRALEIITAHERAVKDDPLPGFDDMDCVPMEEC